MQKQMVCLSFLKLNALVETSFYLAQEELDPLEMLEASNILDRLPKEFFEKIVSFELEIVRVFHDLFRLI